MKVIENKNEAIEQLKKHVQSTIGILEGNISDTEIRHTFVKVTYWTLCDLRRDESINDFEDVERKLKNELDRGIQFHDINTILDILKDVDYDVFVLLFPDNDMPNVHTLAKYIKNN